MSDKTGVQQALAKNAGGALDRGSVQKLIQDNAAELARALPKHITSDRFIKILLLCIDRNPDLLKCTQKSLITCMVQCAELGLTPGGAQGHAYLIPYRVGGSDTGRTCTLILGYRGLIHLAKRSGELADIEARVVHSNDVFRFSFGLTPELHHVPALKDPGAPLAVYGLAKLRNGETHVEVMTWAEVERIRDRKSLQSDSPWKTDPEEMARKTVARRLVKYLEMSPELAQAFDAEDGVELVPEIEVTAPPAPKKRALRVEPTDAELTAGDIDPNEVARQAVVEQAEKALAAAEKALAAAEKGGAK
jgi:recombination protein RecT